MPSLAQLSDSANAVVTQVISSNPVVEPLDGPTSIEDLYDRFPPEVYQQGRDTHLYRLLAALCGDAGAGLLKTQAYALRLQFEAELITHQNLDQTYGYQFRFSRLADETYTVDPTGTLTPGDMQQVELGDQSYYHRAQEYFTALRYGNAPLGLATMAQAGSGIISDVVEHYKYILDQYSDAKLGLEPYGRSTSTSEFVILSRVLNDDWISREWVSPMGWTFTFTPPVLNTTVRPATLTTPAVSTRTLRTTPQSDLTPDVERNVIDLLDRLRPASTFATIQTDERRYLPITLHSAPFASSESIVASRFVTGNPQVNWPAIRPSQGFFIQANLENEMTTYRGVMPAMPVIFHTIGNVSAYTEAALADPLYGSDSFYTIRNGMAPVTRYITEHIGVFFQTLMNIFPALANVAFDVQFFPINALAAQDTQLRVRGQVF